MSFKICSIGCGGMATLAHGPSLRKYARLHPDTELAACCDLDDAKAAAFQSAFGFQRRYGDVREMLRAEKPDAVSLVVPVHLAAGLAIEILEMGFPLIMEKPPGMNRTETLRIIETSERRGVPTQAAFNRRYTPLVNAFKNMILACPSPLQSIRCDFFRVNRPDPDFSTTAIHGIDLVRYVADTDYEHVRFRYREYPALGPNVADVFMDCTLKTGATAQLSICPFSGMGAERLTAHAIGHSFLMYDEKIGSDFPRRLVHIQENQVRDMRTGADVDGGGEPFETGGFYHENASFFDDIRSGRRPKGDVKSALQSVEVAQCIRERRAEYGA